MLQTPNMDFIGRSGTFFRRGYTEVPSCIPARHVLMSGRAPAVDGMVGFIYAPWDPPATLAGELRKAGYETRMIGKLHLQPKRCRFGFDAMELADGQSGEDYVDWLRERGVPADRLPGAHGVSGNGWIGRPYHLPEHQTYSAWVVTRALEFLKKRDPTVPFFLNISFFPPHPPLTPAQPFYDRYERLDLPEPCVGDWVEPFDQPILGLNPEGPETGYRCRLHPQTMQYCRAGYYGLINEIDAQLGRLVNYLRRELLENTFIVFVADHGEMLGDHHRFRKCLPFEASARIPFLARAPRSNKALETTECPPEVVCDAPVGLQDVMPTLLEVAGVPIPESCTGRSLLPLMRGETPEWRDVLHGEHCGQYRYEDGNHFLVDNRHKYIWFSQTGQELFFDLEDDPNELRDLSRQVDLAPWRQRLMEELAERPEGFTDGRRLVPGRPHKKFVPGKGPDVPWHVSELPGAR